MWLKDTEMDNFRKFPRGGTSFVMLKVCLLSTPPTSCRYFLSKTKSTHHKLPFSSSFFFLFSSFPKILRKNLSTFGFYIFVCRHSSDDPTHTAVFIPLSPTSIFCTG